MESWVGPGNEARAGLYYSNADDNVCLVHVLPPLEGEWCVTGANQEDPV